MFPDTSLDTLSLIMHTGTLSFTVALWPTSSNQAWDQCHGPTDVPALGPSVTTWPPLIWTENLKGNLGPWVGLETVISSQSEAVGVALLCQTLPDPRIPTALAVAMFVRNHISHLPNLSSTYWSASWGQKEEHASKTPNKTLALIKGNKVHYISTH